MKSIIDRIRERCQPLIVLLGPYLMADLQLGAPAFGCGSLEILHAFNDGTRQVAEVKDCLFVDLLAAYNGAEWLVHSDGCHANDVGHLVVANRIFEVLANNCSGLAKHTKEMEKHIPPWRDESTLAADYGFENEQLAAALFGLALAGLALVLALVFLESAMYGAVVGSLVLLAGAMNAPHFLLQGVFVIAIISSLGAGAFWFRQGVPR